MNIYTDIRQRVALAIDASRLMRTDGRPLDLSRLAVEPPRDPAHGDVAANAAMVLAKQVGQNPRDVAQLIAEQLRQDPQIAQAEIAGPGFINIRLEPAYWTRFLKSVLEAGDDFGRGTIGQGERVNVEYVSTNPTGPLHVGHSRGAVVGDAVANVLQFVGYDVTKEYYINDAGSQIDTLARSAYLRYREACGEAIGEIPAGLYPGEYLKRAGVRAKQEFGTRLMTATESEWLPAIKALATDEMMDMIREDLALLNVYHDEFASEKQLHAGSPSLIDTALAELEARDLVFTGTLPAPKGGAQEDWEDREQLLFRATQFGDDMDRPLKKSDGTYTYFAADVAYFKSKHSRGFRRTVYVLGADHSGYKKRLQAIGEAIAGDAVEVQVLFTQLVKLFRAGEPVRMSKRSGDFITLRELVEEVGLDAVRFIMLYRKADAPLDFDFQKVTEQTKDNPVFYVQYAHARCHSIFRQAQAEVPSIALDPQSLGSGDLDLLIDEGERGLIRRVSEFPRVLAAAASASEPHRIAFYLHDLAADFHGHWNRGKELPNLRYINADGPELTRARLALVESVRQVIHSGLTLLGVSVPTEMR